jgi:hypothetical protein
MTRITLDLPDEIMAPLQAASRDSVERLIEAVLRAAARDPERLRALAAAEAIIAGQADRPTRSDDDIRAARLRGRP